MDFRTEYLEHLDLFIALIALGIASITAYYQFFRKPKLEISYKDTEPFKVYTVNGEYKGDWIVRLKVVNKKKSIARNCFGKIIEWHKNGKRVLDFNPIKLNWASNTKRDFKNTNLSYKEFDYLETIQTLMDSHSIQIPGYTFQYSSQTTFNISDEHKFKVVVYSENEAFKFKCFKISHILDKEREDYDINKEPEKAFDFIRVEEIEDIDINNLKERNN